MQFLKPLLNRFLIWRIKNLKDNHFKLILSFIVGAGAGIISATLKNTVHIIKSTLTNGFAKEYHNYYYFVFPTIGLLITLLVIKYIVKSKIFSGVPSVLFAISSRKGRMDKHSFYSSLITAPITVGFGGSVGLEGPGVGSSSGFGSELARIFRLNYQTTTLLLACGAAGAMAGIFNAPITAIIFALEVIMIDLSMASLIPLLIASFAAAVSSNFIIGSNFLFPVTIKEFFQIKDIPFFMFLGIITGLVSVYFSKMYWFIENQFKKITSIYSKLILGGVMLGILIFIIPPLYGEGYETINDLINGNYKKVVDNSLFYNEIDNVLLVSLLILGMAIFKVIATSATINAGGVGSVFAPSLFIGSAIGFSTAKILNYFNITQISETNFTLVGMAGIMSGILHAPFTAMFLIVEITGGYQLILPLMIVVVTSYLTSKYFVSHSIYNMQLIQNNELITHHKDKAVLKLLDLKPLIETNLEPIYLNQNLGELVKIISHSNRNIFPVFDENNKLLGVVFLDDIRDIMFKPELYLSVFVYSIMTQTPAEISSDEDVESVMNKFNTTDSWILPVIDNGEYKGFISKSKLFNAYRKILVEFSSE